MGVLDLARRATATKRAPQRWQDSPIAEARSRVDVVVVFEQRLFETVMLGRQGGRAAEGAGLGACRAPFLAPRWGVRCRLWPLLLRAIGATCSARSVYFTLLSPGPAPPRQDVQHRDAVAMRPLHVICMDTRDSPKDAVAQGKHVLELCRKVRAPAAAHSEVRKRARRRGAPNHEPLPWRSTHPQEQSPSP